MIRLDPKDANFHIKFASARNALGLTQNQLAEGLGISLAMVQRYEMSRDKKYSGRPRERILKRIEAFFSSQQAAELPPTPQSERPLQNHSLDALVEEIRSRGYKVNLTTVD